MSNGDTGRKIQKTEEVRTKVFERTRVADDTYIAALASTKEHRTTVRHIRFVSARTLVYLKKEHNNVITILLLNMQIVSTKDR